MNDAARDPLAQRETVGVVRRLLNVLADDLRDLIATQVDHLAGPLAVGGDDDIPADHLWQPTVSQVWRAALSRATPGIPLEILEETFATPAHLQSYLRAALMDRTPTANDLLLASDLDREGIWMPVTLVAGLPLAWWPALGLRMGLRWRITGDLALPVCQVHLRLRSGTMRVPLPRSRDLRDPVTAPTLLELIQRMRQMAERVPVHTPHQALDLASVDPLLTAAHLLTASDPSVVGYRRILEMGATLGRLPPMSLDTPGFTTRLALELARRPPMSPLGAALVGLPFEVGGWSLRPDAGTGRRPRAATTSP